MSEVPQLPNPELLTDKERWKIMKEKLNGDHLSVRFCRKCKHETWWIRKRYVTVLVKTARCMQCVDRAFKLYKQGVPVATICKETGIPETSFYKILKERKDVTFRRKRWRALRPILRVGRKG